MVKGQARKRTKTAEEPEGLMPTGEIGVAELNRRVADKLKLLRKERNWSLDDLSKRSGVSRAALSQIEQCKTNPTLGVLWRISSGLDVPFSTLLGDESAGRARVLRWRDLQPLRSADGGMESRLLMPAGAFPGVESYELKLEAHAQVRSEPHARGTTENITVLTGTVRVHVGDESFELGPGDSLYFAADVTHAYENTGRTPARCLDLILYHRPG